MKEQRGWKQQTGDGKTGPWRERKKDKKKRVNIETPRVTAGETNNNETNPKLKERSSIECLYNTDQLRNKQNESEPT